MRVHTLTTEVILGAGIDRCWEFFCNPANLNGITPDDLDFQIVSPLPSSMYNGLMIEYAIRIPFFGRRRWLTEIRHVVPSQSFVDEQRCGPFRFWHHRHTIEQHAAGVRCLDHVTYVMPYGVVGELLHALVIERTLARIFDFRQQRLRQILAG